MIYNKIFSAKTNNKTQVAVLLDPDNYSKKSLLSLLELSNSLSIDYLLIGGSIVNHSLDSDIELIKSNTKIPVILFPGSLLQLSLKADGILLLSLISGRNPELLIGNHVIVAPFLKSSNLEIISTGYILISSGNTTSVEYMSNTVPIPASKPEIAVATAIAGEMLGCKLIYLEAGSGANYPVNNHLISEVKNNISIPLVVGGGIRTEADFHAAKESGADLIVLGNVLETHPEFLKQIL
ncbi:MAG: geranylgeranylglyceryl/heptaprenylglyceryl phosphate synthase [Bacteroidota bacterium]